jgi:RHS repeat-associated protein
MTHHTANIFKDSHSFITDLSGEAVQHLQYLPFGESFVTQTSTSWQTRYTFSGKEKDEETGYSYFGARYYDGDLSIWLSVDPLADKYPNQSAYSYVGGRPINVIDPNGEDEWELDNQGNVINRIENKDHDSFHIVEKDKDGNYQRVANSEEYKYGTVESQRSELTTYQHRNDDGTRETRVTNADIYKIRGDENASEIFEFVANNTSVEWSQTMTGQTGKKGLNFLTTGHIEYTEPGFGALLKGQLQHHYTIRKHIHNHPRGTARPSGFDNQPGDVSMAKNIEEWYSFKYSNRNDKPKFELYIPKKYGEKRISYNGNSRKEDF